MIIKIGNIEFQAEAISYMAEIIIAELLFTHMYNRRSKFWLRFIFATLLSLVIASSVRILDDAPVYIKFFRLLIILVLSIGVMWFSYNEKPMVIISSCTAGIATQHFAVKLRNTIELLFSFSTFFQDDFSYQIVSELVVFGAVYVGAYFLFAEPAKRVNYKRNADARLGFISATIVITCIGINRFAGDSMDGIDKSLRLATGLYAMLCCVLALVIQFNLNRWSIDRAELQMTKRLLKEESKQYEQWKNSIDFVNIRCHDIKHMLSDIKEIVDKKGIEVPGFEMIENTINRYAYDVRTGNEVLDVMLNNMSELCRNNNIQLSCVANTKLLENFDGMELYTLFCNAIDNAIDNVKKIEDASKRIIDVTIREFGESVIIHMWNYYVGEINFSDGLPVRESNDEMHGFGMKSMKMIVERAGGTMNVYMKGEVFNLDIILPVKTNPTNKQTNSDVE